MTRKGILFEHLQSAVNEDILDAGLSKEKLPGVVVWRISKIVSGNNTFEMSDIFKPIDLD